MWDGRSVGSKGLIATSSLPPYKPRDIPAQGDGLYIIENEGYEERHSQAIEPYNIQTLNGNI